MGIAGVRTKLTAFASSGMLAAGSGFMVIDVDSYERGGVCWVITGSTQYGRAYADPKAVPNALPYYRALAKEGDVVYRISPESGKSSPFSFDFSFNYYPLSYDRPGPEIVIYKLHNCDTAG